MKVGLCCIGRMENKYAVEFVEYYKLLGIDKIFIYDNNYGDEEHFEEVLQSYIDEGLVEITNFRDKSVCQLEAYQDCYDKHKDYDWICYFDFDEYLTFANEKLSIKDFLDSSIYRDFDMIHVNWKVYDDNDLVRYEDKPLCERFKKPKMPLNFKYGYNFPENNHVKTIVRGNCSIKWNTTPHTPTSNVKCCNADGVECNANSPFSEYTFKTAWLRHYQTKTIEEYITVKKKRGFPDGNKNFFKKNDAIKEFFNRNKKTDEKVNYLKEIGLIIDEKIILSMTTIPKRKDRLTDNLPAILNQSYKFDKLIINIDDNLSDDDYDFYNALKKIDDRIEINKAEAKWRSCNKLLPTLKKYPDDVIITVDDDIYYPKDTIKKLVEKWKEEPDCIIAHEINPIAISSDNKYVTYLNAFDIMLMQKEFGKYFSNCCLFPPHVFDGTDLYDYDKMMECTNGTHDELWFWVQSTINGVYCIGLDYVRSFAPEMLKQYEEGEYQLTNINNSNEKIKEYMDKINGLYGEKLLETIFTKRTKFFVDNDNVQLFIAKLPSILRLYDYGFSIVVGDITKAWDNELMKTLRKLKN